jgi:hypothetical protein
MASEAQQGQRALLTSSAVSTSQGVGVVSSLFHHCSPPCPALECVLLLLISLALAGGAGGASTSFGANPLAVLFRNPEALRTIPRPILGGEVSPFLKHTLLSFILIPALSLADVGLVLSKTHHPSTPLTTRPPLRVVDSHRSLAR